MKTKTTISFINEAYIIALDYCIGTIKHNIKWNGSLEDALKDIEVWKEKHTKPAEYEEL